MPQSISPPDQVQKVTLRVAAPSPSAEIFVIDHRLQLVDRGAGVLVTHRPPGIYKIKVQTGRDTQEKTVLLLKDESVMWERQPIDSAAPLTSSGATHEYHMAGASEHSRKIDVSRGSGGRLFVMVRNWSSNDPSRVVTRTRHPAAGLRVAPVDRSWSEELAGVAVHDVDRDAWCAINMSLDPGSYLLQRAHTSGTILEQAVTVSRDWQTQVFLLDRTLPARTVDQPDRPAPDADLSSAAILVSRNGFDPEDYQFQLTETARLALADHRPVLNRQLDEMLRGKFDNPMLGIMGAHLLLLAREDRQVREADRERRQQLPSGRTQVPRAQHPWDQSLFDTVVRNLHGLVGGDHPDVQALSLRASDSSLRPTRVIAPPMLRRSWSLLVAASNHEPDLVPVDLWRRTAMRTAATPFLCWMAATGDPSVKEDFVNDLKAQIAAPMRSLESPRPRAARAPGPMRREEPQRDTAELSLALDIPRAAMEWLVKGQ